MSPLTTGPRSRMSLDVEAVSRAAHEALPGALELLEDLILVNTHADNQAGQTRARARLREPLRALGFSVEELPGEGPPARTHLRARRTPASVPAGRRVLLLGHLDTVHGSDDRMPLRKHDDRWCGPGTSDMKGGIVTAMLCLQLLHRFGRLDDAQWTMLLVGDEEQGSPTATSLLHASGESTDVAVCFEAARTGGGLVVARKGVGVARLEVRGRTGHAGIDFERGINALSVLSRLLARTESLVGDGVTVSPGGGVEVSPSSVNAIPDRARCEIEWRYPTREQGDAVWAALRRMTREEASATGAAVELTLREATPPMSAGPGSEPLLARYLEAADRLGLRAQPEHTAGAGDINLVARPGVACLDGVGPEGGGFHGPDEHVLTRTIAQRAAMNVLALAGHLDGLSP